jgi:hypothetical protein
LPDRTPAQQHALAGVGPVHPPQLDRRIVPAPVEDVGFGDPVRGQHAGGILRIDGEVGASADFRGGKPAFRLKRGAIES